jgi:hypothetical protein
MNGKTLKALRGSIEKWEKIVAGTGEELGASNCPLCHEFLDHRDRDEQACRGCPVREASGSPGCENTPYETYTGATDDAERLVAAKGELEFLRGLLP